MYTFFFPVQNQERVGTFYHNTATRSCIVFSIISLPTLNSSEPIN